MFIKIAGIKLAYTDQGQGIPILFIHGFPLNRSLWHPQIVGLSHSYRTITLDLRGHGETQAVPGPYCMELLANDCHLLLDALGINQPLVICGLSMGGYISLAFFRQRPSRVAGLVLAATRANADSHEAQKNRNNAIAIAKQQGAKAISESMLPKMLAPLTYQTQPELVKQVQTMMTETPVEGIIGSLAGMRDRIDSSAMLPSITTPTLVIHGAEDQLIPTSVAQEMCASIPKSSLYVLPEAGHLVNMEKPELFNQVLSRFLASLPQGR